MESGLYNEPRSYHDVRSKDGATEALLTNTFSAPLPYVGTTLSGLKEYPAGYDQVATRDTGYPHHYTSWNFQTHGVITSFFTLEPAAVTDSSAVITLPAQSTDTYLLDGALQQILRMDTCLSATQATRLRNGTSWLSNSGAVVNALPSSPRLRSSLYTHAEAEIIANSIGAPYIPPRPPSPSTTTTPGPSAEAGTNTQGSEPTEPAERSRVERIPARSVKVRYASFQAAEPTKPPMSVLCQQIQAAMANTEKSATQPLLSTVRSPLARDMASLQLLIAYMETSNVSYIDTAPALRGLCYAAAQYGDMYDFDRTTNHFLREEILSTAPVRTFRTYARPAADRFNVNVITVTLPAYTNHLKNHDTHLAAAGWALQAMEQTWCAVPVTTDLMQAAYLPEYIMCFLDTAVWAGRVSYSTNTTHRNAEGAAHRTRFTQIPFAHNISVPGPHGIMLVLLDESVSGANAHVNILRPAGMNVYPGSPYIRPADFNMANYLLDATNLFHDLINDYALSAYRMCPALEWIETQLCTDMAFQLAFSMAAELTSGLPESPTMEVANVAAHRYQNPLNGAWTIGQRHYTDDNPRHTTSDINAGLVANRSETYIARVCGYNWATVSPLLQYSQSVAGITNVAVIENDVLVAYQSYWTLNTLIEDRPQYQCHAAHSTYRVMTALGLINKNDYKLEIRTPAGLQSMLVFQGSALSMSLSLYLTNNDFDRWLWSGLHPDRTVAMSSSRNKINSTLLNHIIPLPGLAVFARNSRPNHTIGQDITGYYGVELNRQHWALSIPIPFFATLQWAAKFNLPTYVSIPGHHGNVTEEYTTSYVEITCSERLALPWYASTGNTFRRMPRILSLSPRNAPVFLPISVDNWAIQTIGRNGSEPTANGFVSNVFCVLLRYHYRDVATPASVLLLSGPIGTPHLLQPTSYPDPPTTQH